MKPESALRDMHMEALLWKSTLQHTEKQLDDFKNKLDKAKLDNDVLDRDSLEYYTNTSIQYLKRIERLKNRVSRYENKLSLLNECDTSLCDNAFLEEADDISLRIENCSKNVKILSSSVSHFEAS